MGYGRFLILNPPLTWISIRQHLGHCGHWRHAPWASAPLRFAAIRRGPSINSEPTRPGDRLPKNATYASDPKRP